MSAELELPPARQAELEQLLAEVPLAHHREHRPDPSWDAGAKKCWRCGRRGKLVLHHLDDGTVVELHRSCHRRTHRRGRRR